MAIENSYQLIRKPTKQNKLEHRQSYGVEYGEKGKAKLLELANLLCMTDFYLEETTILEIKLNNPISPEGHWAADLPNPIPMAKVNNTNMTYSQGSVSINIDVGLQDKIEKVRNLAHLASEREYDANRNENPIDYANFPEYTELHNLNMSMREDLANAACNAVGVCI